VAFEVNGKMNTLHGSSVSRLLMRRIIHHTKGDKENFVWHTVGVNIFQNSLILLIQLGYGFPGDESAHCIESFHTFSTGFKSGVFSTSKFFLTSNNYERSYLCALNHYLFETCVVWKI